VLLAGTPTERTPISAMQTPVHQPNVENHLNVPITLGAAGLSRSKLKGSSRVKSLFLDNPSGRSEHPTQ
jgi:hypothetical protein